MKTPRVIMLLSFVVIGAHLALAAESAGATLQNQNYRLGFDLRTGKYSLTTLPGNTIRDACATVEGWSSTDPGYRRKIAAQGENRLLIECSRADAPTLLLEFTLHSTFIELRAGLKNTTAQPIRIKKIWPLSGGIVFPGAEWTDVRTLDAPSGVRLPIVTGDAIRSSANNLLLTCKQAGLRRSLVLGALKTADFTKWAHVIAGNLAGVEAYDPIGRLVDPGETYLPTDSFYVDAVTADPFAALEQYGLALRQATGAEKLNIYDFPTVCLWYARIGNNSGALILEAATIKRSGFLNYSRAAVRLVPDRYAEYNPQGWWDDEHWRKHRYYVAPYETSEKIGKGMHDNGCLAFTYIQPYIQPPRFKHVMSRDFRETHKDWILNRDLKSFYNLDYSIPAVQAHVRQRFGALRGNLDGLMVDYADQLWLSLLYGRSPERRLATSTYETVPVNDKTRPAVPTDPKMTATGFYRRFFSLLRDGLGPKAWIHERNLEQPDNDLTLGLVDSSRTATDTRKISPAMISRSGLRWYKNRVVVAYDMDSKDLATAWKPGASHAEKKGGFEGWSGTDQDGRRMTLTMAYVAASRLLLANSFRDLKPEVLYDLERTFPYPTEPRSARPIDAFSHTGLPRVYDFAVTPDWHQVTLFNNTLPTREETIAVPLAGDTADGALGLDPVSQYHVYDFWNDHFVGTFKGSDTLKQTLRPGEARMLSIRKVETHPQVLSTNRHIMQGYYELADVKWENNRLSGKAKVVGGEPFKIVIALNGRQPVEPNLKLSADGKLAILAIERRKTETIEWSLSCR